MKKTIIEVDFPIKEVSEQSVREKNIRHGHISTLHIWWARRPLASSRASIYASLIPYNEKENKKTQEFIAKLSKWENSLNKDIINRAREEILKANNGKVPKVLDCFAGGGSIPLEALRLGCETHAVELNPVAVLIEKATLQFPQKYGDKLRKDVEKYGKEVLESARKEIGKFYPNRNIENNYKIDGEKSEEVNIPVGYIWARTIPCQNPQCNAEIPLMRQFWLAKKENKKISLKLIADKENKKINFEIVNAPLNWQCKGKICSCEYCNGTVKGVSALCPICNSSIDKDTTKKLFLEGKSGERMICVVEHNPKRRGKTYRIADKNDMEIFKNAEKYLEKKRKELFDKWGIEAVPDEPMNTNDPTTVAGRGFGFTKWGELLNARQKLALVVFTEKVKEIYNKILIETKDEEYAKAVVSYLAIGISKSAIYQTTFGYWHNTRELVNPGIGRPALPMCWDYAETNTFGGNADFSSAIKWIFRVIEHLVILSFLQAKITQGTATNLLFKEKSFDAIITDPPYYNNYNYAELSDFFYVWLKRSIGDLYSELFATPLTPKSEEIVQNPVRHENNEKAKQFYEEMITKSFKEIHRTLKDDGIAVIVFAHKSTDAWETIINALLNSGLYLTASWPVETEMEERVKAKETASLASSIYMVCRKRTEEENAYFNEIKGDIDKRIKEKLNQFWNEGIVGADFFVSAIGPGVEVFGKYAKVEKLSGEEYTAKDLLEYIRKVVSEFALERILKNPNLTGVDNETRFYLLYRWTFNNSKVEYDEARKLSIAVGISLEEHWDKGGFIKKDKEFISVLTPMDRKEDTNFMGKEKYNTMVDVLHKSVILWENGEKEKIKELLDSHAYSRNEIFWQIVQAISEVLPEGDKEKQLIQGFLYGKSSYTKEAKLQEKITDYGG